MGKPPRAQAVSIQPITITSITKPAEHLVVPFWTRSLFYPAGSVLLSPWGCWAGWLHWLGIKMMPANVGDLQPATVQGQGILQAEEESNEPPSGHWGVESKHASSSESIS